MVALLATLLPLPLLIHLVPLLTDASSCGQSTIPFSLEVLPNGQPVLGCARPSCFGWSREGKPASSPPTFYRVDQRADGYFRKAASNNMSMESGPTSNQNHNYKPQIAKCSSTFESQKCGKPREWVGGIAASINASSMPVELMCCEYEPLKLATDRGVAVIRAGQIVLGGEVLDSGGIKGKKAVKRQFAFDYISDVVKRLGKEDGKVTYEVHIQRMPCLPYPKETVVDVEESVRWEVIRRFSASTPSKIPKPDERSKAFQVPTQGAGGGGGQIDGNIGAPSFPQSSQPQTVVISVSQGRGPVVEGPFIAEPQQQPVSPWYYPSQTAPANYYNGGGGGGGGGGSTWYCFSADTRVRTSNGQRKRMDELSLGDWVLSVDGGKMVYSPVESWIHRVPNEMADFHQIHMEDGRVLKITSKHFIYRNEACHGRSSESPNAVIPFGKMSMEPVFAEKIRPGDCLYVTNEDPDDLQTQPTAFLQKRVTAVEIVQGMGYYAPMTSTGDIVVDGVFASCYTLVPVPVVHFSFFGNSQNWPMFDWLAGAWDSCGFGEGEGSRGIGGDLPHAVRLTLGLAEHVLPSNFYRTHANDADCLTDKN